MPKLIKGSESFIPFTINYEYYKWFYYLKTQLLIERSFQIFEHNFSYWVPYQFYWCKTDPYHQSCPPLPTRFITFLWFLPLNLLLSLETDLCKLYSNNLNQC